MTKHCVVAHRICRTTGKRSFFSDRDARKALGRAQAKREKWQRTETRYYHCRDCDGYHLTSQSRQEHDAAAVLWQELRKIAEESVA
ncbi:hypothetical protein EDD28_0029 [Salana multivorans]|uniref:Uncharacterized protein n=1 Tax=Salana multivorans TaxID=120377 RepID=A0A3N2CZW6_9MICO|nr:hypothetical protein [Salana multivorans]ROR93071.1 hypothetical protein EDD28_2475 [Salana multivorans]ROR95476.1 hypothetical protein EDD28_0029 [Salana multivorans]